MNTTRFHVRSLALTCAALTLATTGHAAITANALTNNALTNNALTNNGLSAQASAQAKEPVLPAGAYVPSHSWNVRAIAARVSAPTAP